MNKPIKMLQCLVAWIFTVGLMVVGASVVSGQTFPTKPIRIVTAGVGGANDFMARLIAQAISGPLGQPVIVDNRAGDRPQEIVFKAPPDGYNVLLDGGSFWFGPLLRKTSYDPLKDFSPVTTTSREVSVLVVTPSLPVTSTKELIALAKAKPGVLNYGSGATGSTNHVAAEFFKTLAGVNIVRVPHKNTGAALASVMSGEVQMMMASTGSVLPLVRAGKVKALAVASPEPTVLAPGLPPVAATVPGYEATSVAGMFVPAKTPAAVIDRLNQEMVRYLKTAEAKEKFLNVGLETVGSSPQELAAAMKSEMTRLGRVIKEAGIRLDE